MMLLKFDMEADFTNGKGRTAKAEREPEVALLHPILLYDGVCGLCNRTVQFALKRDQEGVFRFASLQSPLAGRILALHERDAADLDTMYVVLNCDPANPAGHGEELLERSNAVLYMLRQLGGFWGVVGSLLRLIPRPIRDWGYGVVAKTRYGVFGKYDTCPVPSKETRERFLDL